MISDCIFQNFDTWTQRPRIKLGLMIFIYFNTNIKSTSYDLIFHSHACNLRDNT